MRMTQTSIYHIFGKLHDPRMNRCKKHKLLDIIILSILAVLSGAESYDSIELFGKENFEFLKQFLELKNGIPSHDTINRVFQMLNPISFERCFIEWSQGIKEKGISENVIAIDGKTVRGSKDSFHNRSPLHSVHAWSVENGICLGQIKCGEKANEITAIPKMLDLLDIKGSIILIRIFAIIGRLKISYIGCLICPRLCLHHKRQVRLSLLKSFWCVLC
jgi:predicted transposase YbfD/YdcC